MSSKRRLPTFVTTTTTTELVHTADAIQDGTTATSAIHGGHGLDTILDANKPKNRFQFVSSVVVSPYLATRNKTRFQLGKLALYH